MKALAERLLAITRTFALNDLEGKAIGFGFAETMGIYIEAMTDAINVEYWLQDMEDETCYLLTDSLTEATRALANELTYREQRFTAEVA